jgi:hypothetical protein
MEGSKGLGFKGLVYDYLYDYLGHTGGGEE